MLDAFFQKKNELLNKAKHFLDDDDSKQTTETNEDLPKKSDRTSEPVEAGTKIITIFSPKAGAGKTVIAINTAIALAQLGRKILLLDFSLTSPLDIARSLNIAPQHCLLTIAEYLDKAESAFRRQFEERRTTYVQNLDYFAAILKINQISLMTPDVIKKSLPFLAEGYDYVIIDAGSELSDNLITMFDYSNMIGMVVTPDVLSVYKTEWCLDTLQSLQFPLGMIKIMVNRHDSRGSYSSQELKLVLPCDTIARLPSEGKDLNYALNKQVPIVLESPESKFSIAIRELAAQLDKNKDLYLRIAQKQRDAGEEKIAQASSDFWQKEGIAGTLQRAREVANEKDEIIKLKQKVHKRLVDEMNFSSLTQDVMSMKGDQYEKMKKNVEIKITNLLADETGDFISSMEVRKKFIKEMVDEALGFGPLEEFLKDPNVTEIMVNNKDQVYIEKAGKLILSTKKFVSDQQIRTVIERIIAPLGRRIDESTPMVDARLPDGSRVNAIIPPLALSGPTVTIRKFTQNKLTASELVDKFGSLTQDMAKFLDASVKIRKNMLVSGGTDSGKTTFLNLLSECIYEAERVITIEDAAELKLHHRHWVRLESRPTNIEGKGEVTLRDLFRNTLRMRPDRIIVGEVRGPEVIDMLQAMNTGHDGSMSTVHANSPRDVMTRLDSLMLMSGIEIPLRAIREMISSALHLIVQVGKLSDGSRKVLSITEVLDVDPESMRVKMQDIFVYDQLDIADDGKVIGKFKATGNIPTYFEELKRKRILTDTSLFDPSH